MFRFKKLRLFSDGLLLCSNLKRIFMQMMIVPLKFLKNYLVILSDVKKTKSTRSHCRMW